MQSQGFSKFSWALALFCLPSALFPLALIVSPQFSNLTHLSSAEIDFFSITFWIYPVVLMIVAGVLFKVHKTRPALAKGLLALGFISFYALLFYIVSFF